MLPTYSTPNHLKHNTSPRSEHPPCKGTRLYVANLQHAKSPETQHQPTLWAPMQGYQAVCCQPTARQITWNTTPAHALSTHHARVLGCMLPTYSTPNHLKHNTSPRSEHPCKDTRLYVANQKARQITWNTTPAHALRTHRARVLGCMLPTYSTPNHLKHNTSPRSEHPPCKGTRLYFANLQHAKSPETQHQPTLWAPMHVCCQPTARQMAWNTTPAHALSTHRARVLGCMLPTYSTPNHLKHNTSPCSEHPCKGTRLYVANLQHAKSPETQHQPMLWAPMQGY